MDNTNYFITNNYTYIAFPFDLVINRISSLYSPDYNHICDIITAAYEITASRNFVEWVNSTQIPTTVTSNYSSVLDHIFPNVAPYEYPRAFSDNIFFACTLGSSKRSIVSSAAGMVYVSKTSVYWFTGGVLNHAHSNLHFPTKSFISFVVFHIFLLY
eukprot:TRINITY_DN9643_c0_g1_i5.p2 TRINITY_DN9643_c0_g1~~TRINITY_DN9643_c0_g1_i5.p2  ORF type:complete len:157 (+),score=12.19 TRINITY_DN9643_c0_g1_i5:868-1338(+)